MSYDSDLKHIAAPVSIKDVQQALGVSDTDLGTLCQKTQINRWSKMKPVPFPYIEPSRTGAVTAYGKSLWWWQGHPSVTEVAAGLVIGNYTTTSKAAWIISCGIKFLGFSTRKDAVGAFAVTFNSYQDSASNPLHNNFSYIPPVGGANEPFRLVDFNNYWNGAEFNIIPDYSTEQGTAVVNVNNPNMAKARCSIMSKKSTNNSASGLSFNDLFSGIGSSYGFTVLCSKPDGSVLTPSITTTRSDDFVKEVEINLNDSTLYNNTVFGLYCAYVNIGSDTYYIPLRQTNNKNYQPNTPITYAPNRRVYAIWSISNTTPYYALTFTQKQNYGSGYAWQSVTSMTNFQTAGLMNRWYLKLEMPKKSSTYSLGITAFKLQFAGLFKDARGVASMTYYDVTSTNARFVLKNNEVTNNWDWGSSDNVIITSGSGTQTCYLAIYNLFANAMSYGGTIWRIGLYWKNGQSDFPSEPDVEYGSLNESTHLNITFDAI